jgi:hypothetical protein
VFSSPSVYGVPVPVPVKDMSNEETSQLLLRGAALLVNDAVDSMRMHTESGMSSRDALNHGDVSCALDQAREIVQLVKKCHGGADKLASVEAKLLNIMNMV